MHSAIPSPGNYSVGSNSTMAVARAARLRSSVSTLFQPFPAIRAMSRTSRFQPRLAISASPCPAMAKFIVQRLRRQQRRRKPINLRLLKRRVIFGFERPEHCNAEKPPKCKAVRIDTCGAVMSARSRDATRSEPLESRLPLKAWIVPSPQSRQM